MDVNEELKVFVKKKIFLGGGGGGWGVSQGEGSGWGVRVDVNEVFVKIK